ncbi:hypothetical protein H4R34_004143 [Dimargaris verticillata]|uniref:Uncharacterized protein n=1 Tax=Dimargaris verticillata TaxID=2761393 RepID=A0A9W8AZE9_9FUNG|nr:hypothetical protein H4R34_004143 [Dimargaris verticillata]
MAGSKAGNYKAWLDTIAKQLYFNSYTISLSRLGHAGCRPSGVGAAASPATVEYTFDATNQFPHPFLTTHPHFRTAVDPQLRTLPCVLVLHDTWPGGFDAARWYGGGLALAAMDAAVNAATEHHHRPLSQYQPGQGLPPSHTEVHGNTADDVARLAVLASPLKAMFRPLPCLPPMAILGLSRPGFLRSSPLCHHTFAQEATVVRQLLDLLQIPHLSIFAVGTGAQVALHLMDQLPGRVHRSVLVNPLLQRPSQLKLAVMRLGTSIYLRTQLSSWVSYYKYGHNHKPLAVFPPPTYPLFGVGLSPLEAAVIDAAWYHKEHQERLQSLLQSEGVCYSFGHWRYPGIRSDLIKMQNLPASANWPQVQSPLLCLTTHDPPLMSPSCPSIEALSQLFPCAPIEHQTIATTTFPHFPLQDVSKAAIDFLLRDPDCMASLRPHSDPT